MNRNIGIIVILLATFSVASVSDVDASLFDRAKKAALMAKETASGAASAIRARASAAKDAISKKASAAKARATEVAYGAKDRASALKSAISDRASAARNAISEKASAAKARATEVAYGAKNRASALKSAISDRASAARNAISEKASAAKARATEVAYGAKDRASALKSAISDRASAARNALSEKASAAKARATEAGSMIKTGISNAVSMVKERVASDNAPGLGDTIKNEASNAVSMLKTRLSDAASIAKARATEATSAISKKIKNKAEQVAINALAQANQLAEGFGLTGEDGNVASEHIANEENIGPENTSDDLVILDNDAEQSQANAEDNDTSLIQPGPANIQSEDLQQPESMGQNDSAAVYPEEVIQKIDAIIPNDIDKSKNLEISDLTIEDVQYLADRLTSLAKEGTKKLSLSLKGDKINSDAVLMLLNSLTENHQLLGSVAVSGVQLGDNGVIALAANLENFPGLKYLCLADTGLTGSGAISLLQVISQISQKSDDGTNIQLVDLSHNQISNEFLEVIQKEWESIKGISNSCLKMDDNQITQSIPDLSNSIYLGKAIPAVATATSAA